MPGDPVKPCCMSYFFFGFRALISPGEHPSDPSFIALAQHEGILLMGTEAWQYCNSKSIFACSHWKLELFTHNSLSALLLHVSSSGSTDIPLSLDGWFTPAILHWFRFAAGFVWVGSIFPFLSVQAMHSPQVLANSAQQCNALDFFTAFTCTGVSLCWLSQAVPLHLPIFVSLTLNFT